MEKEVHLFKVKLSPSLRKRGSPGRPRGCAASVSPSGGACRGPRHEQLRRGVEQTFRLVQTQSEWGRRNSCGGSPVPWLPPQKKKLRRRGQGAFAPRQVRRAPRSDRAVLYAAAASASAKCGFKSRGATGKRGALFRLPSLGLRAVSGQGAPWLDGWAVNEKMTRALCQVHSRCLREAERCLRSHLPGHLAWSRNHGAPKT